LGNILWFFLILGRLVADRSREEGFNPLFLEPVLFEIPVPGTLLKSLFLLLLLFDPDLFLLWGFEVSPFIPICFRLASASKPFCSLFVIEIGLKDFLVFGAALVELSPSWS
jgi:hypothetical protein